MLRDVDRFLARAPVVDEGPTLGRNFAVECETWLLSEDPQVVAPRMDLLVSRRTALEAADAARSAAAGLATHGFHKPSGAWWGSDGVRFHRFVVRTGRSRGRGGVLGPGLAALGALAALAVFNVMRTKVRRTRSRA